VAADPRHPHEVSDWAMRLTVAGQPVLAKGIVRWTGAPRFSQRQFVILGSASVIFLVLLATVYRRQKIDLRKLNQGMLVRRKTQRLQKVP
jgi:hypothetical protein